mgnify:CR=1 FL=1
MTFQTITTTTDAGVMTVTLNRPDRLNAFTRRMMEELMTALDHADADDAVRAVIVTGAGRGFCAGVDLDNEDAFTAARVDPRSSDPAVWADPANRDMGGMLTLRLFNCLKPVIAAVNGPAVGIGATMQLAMDFRLASDTARFGFVFARRGIVPEAASAWFLPRLVGMAQAMEWCMTGRVFLANVGANASHRFAGPVFDDFTFEFLPIPEDRELQGSHAVRYRDLRSFYRPATALLDMSPSGRAPPGAVGLEWIYMLSLIIGYLIVTGGMFLLVESRWIGELR